MIDKMQKYSFILLSGESEAFLEKLQELGVVDITRSQKPVDEESSAKLEKILKIRTAISTLEALDYTKDADYEAIRKAADSTTIEGCKMQNTLGAKARLEELAAATVAAKKVLSDVQPWGEYDKEAVEGLAAKGIKLHYYSVQAKAYDKAWEELYPISIISNEGGKVFFVAVSKADETVELPVPECPAPDMSIQQAEEKLASLAAETVAVKGKLLNLKENHLPHMRQGLARKTADLDKYLAGSAANEAAEGYISTFEGFAPVDEKERLEKEFDEAGLLYISENAVLEDNPPIQLKNNKFVQMFEVLTDMYGRPKYNGFDPTIYISIFFMLFFAMCMGDCGYGLVLIVLGFLLKKVQSFKSLAPLVVTLGIATVVVGFFFHTFFSIDMLNWGWIQNSGIAKVMVPAKIATFDGTMVVAIIIGIIHLSVAMIVKTVYATKNNGFLNSLSVWGWTLFLVGTVVALAAGFAFHLDSSVTKWIIIGLGIVGAIGIFPLRNLHKNPLINVGAGLWETYNTATGVLGDVLSYLRLYALGLAGSMLGYAFNDLAKMALGDGGFGWVPFIIIALIGHVLNIAMAALGAFVHPLRLNFLEFFKNSDYDGSGRNYNPLKK